MAQKYTAAVVEKEKISPTVYLVTFKLLEPSSIVFHAGQCIMLMIKEGVNRTMSIASPPSQSDRVMMIHDVSPGGPGSVWTVNLKIGDPVTFLAPTGALMYNESGPKKKVFVATGTGIAPFHSMMLAYPDAEKELFWGLRHEEDIYWKEEFEKRIPFHLILSQPRDTWNGERGHVTEHVIANVDIQSEYYICGNRSMVEDVKNQLFAKNVSKDQIKSELFY